MRKQLIILILFLLSVGYVSAQGRVGIKTNLLYDATSTLNLGVEFGLAQKWTLDISGNYNPWTFSDNHKMKHWLVQPEIRYWLCEGFNRSFFGVHAHVGQFNFGGMLPFGLRAGSTLSNFRYEGWAYGMGISYGYQWLLSSRWSIEASLGLGFAQLNYDKYWCPKCYPRIDKGSEVYVGPTKVAVSLIYFLK